MSNATSTSSTHADALNVSPRERRKVAAATLIGTTVEWYDFFIYANSAALVFAQLYFEPVGSDLAILLSFATIGISFLFRPLGAVLAGHIGDRFGRKAMLVATLVLMGVATALIGFLPTYSQIGIAAPIILLVLRILQGISAGGEWGGAALMAVEFAPEGQRGKYGSSPQVGTPIGLMLATAVIAIMSIIAPGDAFLEWGWRVPFMLSIALIVVGLIVRKTVEESPVFEEFSKKNERTKVPVVTLMKKDWLLVVLAGLTFAGNNACGYILISWVQAYATNPEGPIGLDRSVVLFCVTAAAAVWLVSTYYGGVLSDRIGRKKTYMIGWGLIIVTAFPMFMLVNTGEPLLLTLGLALFAIGLGINYGPQSAYFAELFPINVRYSGIGIAYALGGVLGGGILLPAATAIVQQTGSSDGVALYLIGIAAIAAVATMLLRDPTGVPLHAKPGSLPNPLVWKR